MGWVVGEDGLILHTVDGGQTWLVQISGVPGRLRGVIARSAREALAVGQNGVILVTTDGGRRWRHDRSGTSTTLAAIAFQADQGWTVGRDGVILRYAGPGAGKVRTLFDR